VLSDFDGTLAPIAADPAAVWLDEPTRGALATLARSPQVRIGIVSGRALGDVRARVGVVGLTYAGCHGLQVEGPGFAWSHPDAIRLRGSLVQMTGALQDRIGSIPGVRVEDKELSVALHYRSAAPDAEERLEAATVEVLRRRPSFTVVRGKKVIEVLPDVGWNKRECALWLRDVLFRDQPALVTMLYVGDDETDEQAFRALTNKAFTACVGPAARSAAA
jgi:trehalose-phosphatase